MQLFYMSLQSSCVFRHQAAAEKAAADAAAVEKLAADAEKSAVEQAALADSLADSIAKGDKKVRPCSASAFCDFRGTQRVLTVARCLQMESWVHDT